MSGAGPCEVCANQISGEFYRVGEHKVCSSCTLTLKAQLPADTDAAFTGAILYGIGGAVIGLAVYSGFVIATGWTIGYLALFVGWLVAKGVMMGSKGIGGPRYQAVAVTLTYFAISLSSLATRFAYIYMHPDANIPEIPFSRLILLGLASPILRVMYSPMHILGLVILFVGLSIAYRLTKSNTATQFKGPFTV